MSRYPDGDLDDRDRGELEAHLGACPRCHRQLASLKTTIQTLGSMQPQTPTGLADSVIAALRVEGLTELAADQRPRALPGPPVLPVVGGALPPAAIRAELL